MTAVDHEWNSGALKELRGQGKLHILLLKPHEDLVILYNDFEEDLPEVLASARVNEDAASLIEMFPTVSEEEILDILQANTILTMIKCKMQKPNWLRLRI